jgi:hypothetical protein
MRSLSFKVVTAVTVVGICVGTSFAVYAQTQNKAPQVSFASVPGPDSDTDCIVPKAAGVLRSTSVETDQSGIVLWSTYEDANGNVRVYRLYHPSRDARTGLALAGIITGNANVATDGIGPAGSKCDYFFKTVRQ